MPRETYEAFSNAMVADATTLGQERWEPRMQGTTLVQHPLSYYLDRYVQTFKATGPDRSNLKGALRDICKKNKSDHPNFAPKLFNASEEELQKRMRHADACMEAMKDAILDGAEQRLRMYDTIAHLFGPNGKAKELLGPDWELSGIRPEYKSQISFQINSLRFMWDLMDIRDVPEAKEHNERAIMLAALNERKISEEDYRKIRESQLKDRYPETYQSMIKQELEHSFDEMFDMMRASVETKRAKRNSVEMQRHLACVCDVNETDPKKLSNAYRALFDGCSEIGMNGTYIHGEIQRVYKNPDGSKIKLTQQQLDILKIYETEDCKYRNQMSIPAMMANPYSAILDQQELADFNFVDPKLPPKSVAHMNALFLVGVGANTIIDNRRSEEYRAAKETKTRTLLESTGMQGAEKRDTQHPGIHVYEKDGQKLIVRNEHDIFGDLHVRADVPGQLISCDLNLRLSELDETCAERDQGWGSKAYTAMRNALHALKDTTLSDNPTAAELKAFQKKLEDMQEKVDAYMERKRRQRTAKGDMDVIGGKPYEQQRISFARELGAFTQDKLAAIETIRNHQAVMQRGLGEINGDPNQPAPAMREPEPNGVNPQRRLTNIREITKARDAENAAKNPKAKSAQKVVKRKVTLKLKTDEKTDKKSDKKNSKKVPVKTVKTVKTVKNPVRKPKG